ncbi:antitoxin VbhA family protein [Fusobacterium gastrosuis]|uniref:antitoxin VbhA family protein n=1 Tax=Fusobacterium gastrosuis TaxID=1755100 RepID=UPI0029713028|nr:antitoxin VbhA family protein [Fusobacteriaceae bacterium]MDY5714286.1 antitoxin VbhA family protein [Fusobacterium gastrosuis]
MIDRTKLSPIIKEAVAVTEAECGKMSDEQITILIRKEKGEITTKDVIRDLKKKYGVG